MARPPRLARWLLQRALPSDAREDISGDLEELFQRRVATSGARRARVWFWRQCAAFASQFFAERMREWRRSADMSSGFSMIDLKLAVRMLVRYPGLTIVSVLGMAVGITIAAATFTIVHNLMNAELPVEEGDRVVAVGAWDARTNNEERRVLHDLASWRELKSVQDIGAVRTTVRNLIAPGAQPETVPVAEINASAFRVTRVDPALGRYLLPEDERPGAPDVVVIGDEPWKRRFAGNAGILGQEIQLGSRRYTVVGVMPEGFKFPSSHNYWIPLRTAASYAPRSGPDVTVFGRLAPGASLESAQAELEAIAARVAASSPATHEHLRARVVPYTHLFTDMTDPDGPLLMHAVRSAILLMLALICVNVAVLVYARTATRQGEIAVRSALGASRLRIVGQLFLEALILASVAAVAALALLSVAVVQLRAAMLQVSQGFPYWFRIELSTPAIVSVIGLTLLAAAIVGIVPALKATGRKVQSRLQGLSAGSGSRMQMGRVWTVMIVAQVAVAVAVLPTTVYEGWNALRFRTAPVGYAIDEYLSSGLMLERAAELALTPEAEANFRTMYAQRRAELERRLEAEPAVSKVTFSLVPPGEELAAVIEVDGAPAPAQRVDYNIVEGTRQGHFIRFNRVALDYFDAFDVRVLTGRLLQAGDDGAGATGVVVDRTFVDRLLGGSSALGRRFRYVGRSREAGEGNVLLGRWYEVVGVINDFPPNAARGAARPPRVYHAAPAEAVYPAAMAIRVRGAAPGTFADRLRQIGAAVDPALQLRNISTAEDARTREQGLMRLIGGTLIAVTLSVVVLSAAGIYALMSFTVARRRKEIGIRAALGADPRRLLTGIFSRAAWQLGLGAALGMVGALAIEHVDGEIFEDGAAVVLPLVALLMMAVGLLAAWGPARRGLAVQPTQALREE